MERTEQNHKTSLWQVIKFTLFSISAGIIQILSFTLLTELLPADWLSTLLGKVGLGCPAFLLHEEYGINYLIALILSVVWNFTFNRRYTFRSDADVKRSMLLVALFYVVFAPVSTWWGIELAKAGWNEYVILIGTMLINFVTEFLYQRFVVYRNNIDTNDVARRAKEKEQQTEA